MAEKNSVWKIVYTTYWFRRFKDVDGDVMASRSDRTTLVLHCDAVSQYYTVSTKKTANLNMLRNFQN